MELKGSALGRNNLLVQLYRLAHRRQENFTMDSLVYLCDTPDR